MPSARDRFASCDPAVFLLQVMDGRGVWRTRKRLGCVIAAVSEVARAPLAYAGLRLRLVEVGLVPATGATVHREILRAGGYDIEPLDEALGEDARALVSALRGVGERPLYGTRVSRADRPRGAALHAPLSVAVVLTLGAGLLGDMRSAARDAPGAAPSPLAAAPPLVGERRSALGFIGAALAHESVVEPAAAPPADLTFGVSWRETLGGAKRSGRTCREASPALVACDLGRGVWLRDAQNAQLLFDRREGHLAAVLVVSRLLVDRATGKDGREIKRRFAEIKEAIDRLMPTGPTALVRADARAGVSFWSGLRAADGQGMYAAYWTAEPDAGGPTVTLRLYGIDADRGFYKLLVRRPS